MKKSQASIITIILLILLVLAAIVIVWQVIQNIIKTGSKNIEGTSACLDAMDELKIDEKESCYTSDNPRIVDAKVQRKLKNIEINEFVIVITSQGNSEKFGVKEGDDGSSEGIFMFDDSPILQIPFQGESKTYKITTTFTSNIDYLQVAPIINDKLCSPSEKVKINACP